MFHSYAHPGRVLILLACCGTLASAGPDPDLPPNDRSPVHRPHTPANDPPAPQNDGAGGGPAVFPFEFRTIDGSLNNFANPLWGAAGIELLRQVGSAYSDGVGSPAGESRPSARLVSNLMAEQTGEMPNTLDMTDFIWQWGQFLDHDLDETPVADPAEAFDILVPAGDPWFDPKATGEALIPLSRSAYSLGSGVREQFNNITAWIDASNVYGSDENRALALRTLDGTGMLRTSPGDLLPFNTEGFANAPTSEDPSFFLAGDIRANEQVGLTAMHTLFVREHNRLASDIAAEHPELTGDEIYERARAIVGAEMQAITYNEFLPALLGPDALEPMPGYDPALNAGISNLFATAAYRVGHTMLSPTILRLDDNGDEIPAGHLALADAFFVPSEILDHGIDPILRGLAARRAQQVDPFVVDDIRNFLFGPPGSGGFDLASLNIQRGRDHGLPDYNAVRVAYGLPPAASFADITPDSGLQTQLADTYASVDDIDAWVGLLCEPHRPGAMVGETLCRVLGDQFTRLRDGDRFWYQTYLPPETVALVESLTLAEIIRLNTGVGSEMQDDVFRIYCIEDLNNDGAVDSLDLNLVLENFGKATNDGDINGDSTVDAFDLNGVLAKFGKSCG